MTLLYWWLFPAGFVIGWYCGYRFGKRMLISILEEHIVSGRMLPIAAINYERDVLDGRIPH